MLFQKLNTCVLYLFPGGLSPIGIKFTWLSYKLSSLMNSEKLNFEDYMTSTHFYDGLLRIHFIKKSNKLSEM